MTQCGAVRCRVVQCVAEPTPSACFSSVLEQCVAACCSMTDCGAVRCSALQSGALCCSVLQNRQLAHAFQVCMQSVLQCVAV